MAANKHSTNESPQRHYRDKTAQRVLCRIEDIADGDSKEIDLLDESDFTLCLIRWKTAVYAYRNSCPHTGAPLNWTKDKFLSLDGAMIQCGLHGALFRIEDGLCTWGPCLNKRLLPIPVAVRNGNIVLVDENKTERPL